MCATEMAKLALLLVVMTSQVFSAPVADLANDAAQISMANKNTNQDEDLAELMNLVNQQANQQNVMVHQQEMTHFENDNGKTTEVKQQEEKVLDTQTGDVIADVKQEVKQESSPEGAGPETVVETEVDIPSEGVHETVVQTNPEEDNAQDVAPGNQDTIQGIPSDDEPAVDLLPVDMAEFLLTTQQFDLFYAALNKLVNQSKMTAEEAEEYARIVALEYERLQLEEPLPEGLMDQPVVAQRSMEEPSLPYAPNFVPEGPEVYGMPQQWSAQYPGEYPPEAFMSPEEKYLAMLQQQQQQQLLSQQQQQQEDEINPYDFLSALWEEAYGKGNVEAQAIVQMLYDRVNADDNEDDMGQIRDILVDSLSSTFDDNSEMPVQEDVQVPNAPENAQEQEKRDVESESQDGKSAEEETEEKTEEVVDGEKEEETEVEKAVEDEPETKN